MASKSYTFRFPEEVNDHLDFLCSVLNTTRTGFLTTVIEREYDQYQGNPELQKLISKMQDMKIQMEAMLGGKTD